MIGAMFSKGLGGREMTECSHGALIWGRFNGCSIKLWFFLNSHWLNCFPNSHPNVTWWLQIQRRWGVWVLFFFVFFHGLDVELWTCSNVHCGLFWLCLLCKHNALLCEEACSLSNRPLWCYGWMLGLVLAHQGFDYELVQMLFQH